MKKKLFLTILVSSTLFCMQNRPPHEPDPPSGDEQEYSPYSKDTQTNHTQQIQELEDSLSALDRAKEQMREQMGDFDKEFSSFILALEKSMQTETAGPEVPETPRGPKTNPFASHAPKKHHDG